ncbi:Kappa-carrageenase precursor [Stieleria maiorica]|uniref:Kappa-carrageenase n=1 Tax=Stieleria maiorica TaxID=2795974 RepID=A0A5B9MRV1_9BACT|nr:family 16 glycosylhydrolase [Stieleria maiorica]QEG02645.1 Kappa-carrageenase precursor [Stieleria maiorica]
MFKQALFVSLALTISLAGCSQTRLRAQTARNNVPLSATDADQWRIRWDRSDDFNGNEVDWKKWNKSPENFGAWVWDNENNVAVSGGVLQITMRRLPTPVAKGGRPPTPYTSGMLKSHVTGSYGYYEARLKGAPLFPGVCPSFWLYSKIDDSIVTAGQTRYSEVDIVELTQRGDRVAGNERIADCNLHAILANGKPGMPGREWHRPNDERFKAEQANESRLPFDPRDDFHTYGCEVTPETITWYIDGKPIGQKQNRYWHREMNVALSLGLRPPYSTYTVKGFVPSDVEGNDEFPTTMKVDYVRVWDRVK